MSMFCFALPCPVLARLVSPFENFLQSSSLWPSLLSEYLISLAPSAPVLLHFEPTYYGAGVTSKGSDCWIEFFIHKYLHWFASVLFKTLRARGY